MDEADAKAKGTAPARNQTAIDMLQPGDVIVADVFGADWNFVGNKLAHYIQTTTKNGMIVDGGVYWLERIAATGMQAYYKNSFPTQGMRVMVTGINIPVRIGKTLVMPGDVVLADREGLWFIPPQMVQGRGRIRRDVEGARRLEPDDARDWQVHVAADLWAADAGAAEAARRVRLQEDGAQADVRAVAVDLIHHADRHCGRRLPPLSRVCGSNCCPGTNAVTETGIAIAMRIAQTVLTRTAANISAILVRADR